MTKKSLGLPSGWALCIPAPLSYKGHWYSDGKDHGVMEYSFWCVEMFVLLYLLEVNDNSSFLLWKHPQACCHILLDSTVILGSVTALELHQDKIHLTVKESGLPPVHLSFCYYWNVLDVASQDSFAVPFFGQESKFLQCTTWLTSFQFPLMLSFIKKNTLIRVGEIYWLLVQLNHSRFMGLQRLDYFNFTNMKKRVLLVISFLNLTFQFLSC